MTDATFRIVMLEKQIIDKKKESNGDKKWKTKLKIMWLLQWLLL
jgi:hypothetical protein